MKLSSIKRIIENENLDLEVIVNPKTLDNGANVIQLETAVGAAMKCFEGSIGTTSSIFNLQIHFYLLISMLRDDRDHD